MKPLFIIKFIVFITISCILALTLVTPAIAQTSRIDANFMQLPSQINDAELDPGSSIYSQTRPSKLPESIATEVLHFISQHRGKPAKDFQIVTAQSRTWPDSCLGLAEAGTFCAQILVPGWEVKVTDNSKTWTYRTNASGSVVRLDTNSNQA